MAFPLVWLVFGPRGRLTWRVVALAFAWPVAWLAYTFARGALTHWYPYPFLDADDLGLARALAGGLVVLVGAAVLAVVVKLLDARLPALGTRDGLASGVPVTPVGEGLGAAEPHRATTPARRLQVPPPAQRRGPREEVAVRGVM